MHIDAQICQETRIFEPFKKKYFVNALAYTIKSLKYALWVTFIICCRFKAQIGWTREIVKRSYLCRFFDNAMRFRQCIRKCAFVVGIMPQSYFGWYMCAHMLARLRIVWSLKFEIINLTFIICITTDIRHHPATSIIELRTSDKRPNLLP